MRWPDSKLFASGGGATHIDAEAVTDFRGAIMIKIERIDHFVLRVADVQATCAFYEKVLGMETISFGGDMNRKALRFGQHKINLHPADSDWHPRARDPHPGSEDFCLITETPISEVVAHLEACGVEIEVPPSNRSGALGTIHSVYFRDPDGNLVEVSNYR
jgi:catechol 2,3-dioxygenase-like lactoylglutathione lyase family enzyme